jgi:hypothetical protein
LIRIGHAVESQTKSKSLPRFIFFFHPSALKRAWRVCLKKEKLQLLLKPFAFTRGPEHGKGPVGL